MSDNKPLNSGTGGQDWESWGNHVIKTIEKLEDKVDKLEDKIAAQRIETNTELITLKTKAGVIGTVAGIVASAIVSIVVGVMVYQMTIGYNKQNRTVVPTSPAAYHYVLPPRENEQLMGGVQIVC